jgi:hypothetical protein
MEQIQHSSGPSVGSLSKEPVEVKELILKKHKHSH